MIWLWQAALVPFIGDAGIQTAMKNGGIIKIHHVDFKSESILGLHAKYTTYFYGE